MAKREPGAGAAARPSANQCLFALQLSVSAQVTANGVSIQPRTMTTKHSSLQVNAAGSASLYISPKHDMNIVKNIKTLPEACETASTGDAKHGLFVGLLAVARFGFIRR